MLRAMPAPVVTVAVPVKDRRDQMLRCLDALLAQDHPSFQIMVLDNGSTDGTAQACRDRAAGARMPVRVEPVPGVLGAVRNRAAEIAGTEFLAFTDSDCLPEPGWLTAGVHTLQADPALGVVCGKTLPEVPPTEGWPATIEVTGYTGRFEACNLIFRTTALRESEGFDEEVGHYWEDTAAGYALMRRGWRAAFAEDAVVRHDVTYPGFWWHVKRARKNANLRPVLERYPEIGRDLLVGRVFLHRRDPKLVAALAGCLLAPRRRAALLLALPYATERLRHLHDPKGIAQTLIYDSASLASVLRSTLPVLLSVRRR
jgi:GT2 family glycosyltransferase